jgi:hypothetical protein
MRSKVISVTPTIDTSTAYADGDMMSSVFTIANAIDKGPASKLVSVSVLDKDKVAVNLQILFFNASPTVASALNAALDISDAEMASKFLGSVALSSYTPISSSSIGTILQSACGLKLQPLAGSKDIYGILLCKGAAGGAFASASSIVLKFGIEQE